MSSLCGVCEVGFYRFKNECTECSSDVLLRFFGAIIVAIVGVVLLQILSSTKRSHLTSLFIASRFVYLIILLNIKVSFKQYHYSFHLI